MAQVELIMPKMGESVAEATITKWLKKVGDPVAEDEMVLEIATDKVDTEVPSTAAGTVLALLFKEGDVAQVGEAIAIIGTEGSVSNNIEETALKEKINVIEKIEENVSELPDSGISQSENFSSSDKFFSPLVRNIAKVEGISVSELERIQGTGANGRITKKDILAYLPNKNKVLEKVAEVPSQMKPASSYSGGEEIIEMDRMRSLIADHMVMSKNVAAHVTSFVEADVTNIVRWRDRVKVEFEKREGEKLTFTPIIIEVVAKALRDFPMLNISLDGKKIIKHKNINIGMAAALPSGNLIVPVIKNADTLNLVGLSKKVNDLANRSRIGKLQPDEIQGGTYTISNVGSFGNVMGTPIINQPQVGILAIGVIKKKPAVIETPDGDLIGIRYFMYLSHSYDHRIIDGSLGGQFVRRVADYLEEWDVKREV